MIEGLMVVTQQLYSHASSVVVFVVVVALLRQSCFDKRNALRYHNH